MRISIVTKNGQVDFDIHGSGATVRVEDVVVGSCRWEKEGNTMRLYSLPIDTFDSEEEDEDGNTLVFKIDEKQP